jgi:SAM-dependent methyltransferase
MGQNKGLGGNKDMKERWERLHQQRRFLPKYPCEEVVRYVFNRLMLPNRGSLKILDLGCGGGRHSHFLAKEGFVVFSLDISSSGLHATARRLAGEGLKARLILGDMHHLPFSDESFDSIIAYGSLYYTNWEGMRQSVTEVYRVLKKGCSAFILTRTKDDCRYGKGICKGENTYFFNTDETNEQGMKNCFLGEDDVLVLFSDFENISLDWCKSTLDNGAIVNSDWIIVAIK